MARVISAWAARSAPLPLLPEPPPAPLPRLAEVTLVCVQPRQPALGLATLQHCMRQLQFADVLLFTDLQKLRQDAPGIRVKGLKIDSAQAFADFMLRGLVHYVTTSHVLLVQWDGFVLDAAQWDPAFQLFDYLAAPQQAGAPAPGLGMGSFSLRSRRLLLALQDPAMVVRPPEHLCILHDNRQKLEQAHDVRIAPAELARRFAFDDAPDPGPTFGFAGLGNLARVLDPVTLDRLVQGLPDELLGGRVGHLLCAGVIAQRRFDTAETIIARRSALRRLDWRTWQLRLKAAIARMGDDAPPG